MTALAKITSKGQTTIPQEVRKALGAGPGDLLAWDLAPDGKVTVRRVRPLDLLIRGRLGRLAPSESKAVREALIQLLDCQD